MEQKKEFSDLSTLIWTRSQKKEQETQAVRLSLAAAAVWFRFYLK